VRRRLPAGTGATVDKMNEAHRLRGIATEIDMVTNRASSRRAPSSKESGAAHPWFRYYSDVRMTSAAAGMPTKVILQTVPLRNGKIPPDATDGRARRLRSRGARRLVPRGVRARRRGLRTAISRPLPASTATRRRRAT